MSNDLYWTVLEYHNGRGIAKHLGMTVSLAKPPLLDGYEATALRYIPEIGEAQIQDEPGFKWRRMSEYEIRDADALLRKLTTLPEGDDPDDLSPYYQRSARS
jgi:hypothetical protein